MALWQWPVAWEGGPKLGACRSIRSGFDRPFLRYDFNRGQKVLQVHLKKYRAMQPSGSQ